MKRTVINIEIGIEKTFKTDKEFLEYAKILFHENEDGQPYPSAYYCVSEPQSVEQAAEYIVGYCGDLELTEY